MKTPLICPDQSVKIQDMPDVTTSLVLRAKKCTEFCDYLGFTNFTAGKVLVTKLMT